MELTAFQKKAIIDFKKVGIEFEFIDNERIKIIQKSNYNGYILTIKELHTRARSIFPNQHILPIRFSINLAEIDYNWVNSKIKEFGLHSNDIVSQTAIKSETLPLYLNGEKSMSNTVKALFYYYF